MKINPNEKRVLIAAKPEPAPKPPKPRCEIREVAERFNINEHTLRNRHKAEPDVPLEELAQRPIRTRTEVGRTARSRTPWDGSNDYLFEG